MSFKEFVILATQAYIDNPHFRVGQAMFNTLHSEAPELADEIRGTANDPFHADNMNDQRIKNFFNFIENALNGKAG